MTTIGTDIDIQTCKDEGYMMLEYDGRKKFTPETTFHLKATYPKYTRKELDIPVNRPELIVDAEYTFNELLELYEDDKDSINSFAETNIYVNFNNPTWYDALNLASDINAYKGLS